MLKIKYIFFIGLFLATFCCGKKGSLQMVGQDKKPDFQNIIFEE